MPNPRRITARHKSQFDSRATGNSDRITRLVHAHCLLFECNENMAETAEVALTRCGRRKQPNPRRKNVALRHHSVAKFHGRPLSLFADEFRLRITSAAGADAGSGMMRYSVGVELHVFLFLSRLTRTPHRKGAAVRMCIFR
ncbi:hypothetical protein NP493_1298g00020 [Ridgeia piscesae]|uniref:Uncharacterized protein n=1 Tax=Ridgeia piscesae TaxID=27915 RepID=A0AAD9K9B9_RIDPI|nr:hypothetical protein NP493_1298g00020 [Ridgeia piscesae]